jgi:hypothetical protein
MFDFFSFLMPVELRFLEYKSKPTKKFIKAYKELIRKGFFVRGVHPTDIFNLVDPMNYYRDETTLTRMIELFGNIACTKYSGFFESITNQHTYYFDKVDLVILWFKALEEAGIYIPLHTKAYVAKKILVSWCGYTSSYQEESSISSEKMRSFILNYVKKQQNLDYGDGLKVRIINEEWRVMVARLHLLFNMVEIDQKFMEATVNLDVRSDFTEDFHEKIKALYRGFGIY